MFENYRPNIETFPRQVGSDDTVIGIDLQLEGCLPLDQLPWVNALKVSAPEPAGADDASGNAAGDEVDRHFRRRTGYDIEEELFLPLVIDEPKSAILVGSVSTSTSAEWFLYSGEALADNLEEAVNEQFPELDVQSRAQHDPEWSVYREFLSPSHIERLLIENRRQIRHIDQLDPDDDNFHGVDHTVWFTSVDDRNGFVDTVSQEGFELHYPEGDLELDILGAAEQDVEYGLTMTRPEHVEVDHMDELVRQVFKWTAQCAGDYEGWRVQL